MIYTIPLFPRSTKHFTLSTVDTQLRHGTSCHSAAGVWHCVELPPFIDILRGSRLNGNHIHTHLFTPAEVGVYCPQWFYSITRFQLLLTDQHNRYLPKRLCYAYAHLTGPSVFWFLISWVLRAISESTTRGSILPPPQFVALS